MQARGSLGVRGGIAGIDIAVAVAAVLIFGIIEYSFQYRDYLGESDLYRVLVGLMDGAESGRGLNSPMHYDREFGFGYLAAMYHFVDPAVLRDPDRLTPLMNEIGLWTLIPALVFFWTADSRDAYGLDRADCLCLQPNDGGTRHVRASGHADARVPFGCRGMSFPAAERLGRGWCGRCGYRAAGRRLPVARRDIPRFPVAGPVTDRHAGLSTFHDLGRTAIAAPARQHGAVPDTAEKRR
jgi:hypothetical protein